MNDYKQVIFTESRLQGAFLIDIEPISDERGFFARSYCIKEFEQHGLVSMFVQCSVSHNARKGTLRGMHFQVQPYAETKLVRCTRGSAFDVIVDLRPGSRTFKQWVAFELSEGNHQALYIPEGFAHGFQTLADDTEMFYQISQWYHPEAARGVRWNDPAFEIDWPPDERIISPRDQAFEDFSG